MTAPYLMTTFVSISLHKTEVISYFALSNQVISLINR